MQYGFTIRGRAVPQGSKVAGVNPHTGKAYMREQHGARHKDWRAHLKIQAQTAERRPEAPLEGPIVVSLTFQFKRPLKHYVGNKPGAGRLRDTAPHYVAGGTVGDVDKLVRSVLDALSSAGWYRDDKQVSVVHALRVYAPERLDVDEVTVEVDELDDDAAMELVA